MKKFLLFALLTMMFATGANAQGYYWNGPVPWPASGSFVNGSGPVFYTKLDTVTNTGTDTFKCKIDGANSLNLYNYLFQSLTFQLDVTKINGTPSSNVITLYGSNESGTGVGFVAIQSYTVTTATSQYYSKALVGNPYTNYWIVLVGSGSQSVSWLGTLLER